MRNVVRGRFSFYSLLTVRIHRNLIWFSSWNFVIVRVFWPAHVLSCDLDSETEGRKKTDYHTFSSHIKPQFICHKIIRSFFLGVAVKLAHFARNQKIVTCTPGVSFTGVLAINNSPHWKLFESVSLKCFTRYWSLWSFTRPAISLTSVHPGYKTNCEECQEHRYVSGFWNFEEFYILFHVLNINFLPIPLFLS